MLYVSILTRAFARVQPCGLGVLPSRRPSFNPHSSFRPSATSNAQGGHWDQVGFNPHSSFRPSATWQKRLSCCHFRRFQSSLELSPECNGGGTAQPDSQSVSILTRAFARVQRMARMAGTAPAVVSILTRAFARVQHWDGRNYERNGRKFQSSLELSPECNGGPEPEHTDACPVSILTRAFARVQQERILHTPRGVNVSILTRAFARVQQNQRKSNQAPT